MAFKALGYYQEDGDFAVLSSVNIGHVLSGFKGDDFLEKQMPFFQELTNEELFIIYLDNVTDVIKVEYVEEYVEAEKTATWSFSLNFNCDECGYVDLIEAPDFFKIANIGVFEESNNIQVFCPSCKKAYRVNTKNQLCKEK